MRYFIFLIVMPTWLSCGQTGTEQNAPGVKEKELSLKENELNQKVNDPDKTIATTDTVKSNVSQDTASQPLVLTPLKIDGNIGYVTFSRNNKTVFYFDAATKKGKINLNGVEYILTSMEGSYTVSGNNVNITTTKGKWEEMVSDCAYGKSLIVTIKMGARVLKLNDVEVQDCSGMVE